MWTKTTAVAEEDSSVCFQCQGGGGGDGGWRQIAQNIPRPLGLGQSSGHHGLGGGGYLQNGGNSNLRSTKILKLRRNLSEGLK